jgi:hypothetical protein
MTRLDALRELLDVAKKEDAMNAWTAGPNELGIDVDHVDPICEQCREPESACLCEPDLLGPLEDAMRAVKSVSADLATERMQVTAAEEFARRLLESGTLEEAKTWARDFLGIEACF